LQKKGSPGSLYGNNKKLDLSVLIMADFLPFTFFFLKKGPEFILDMVYLGSI